MKKSTASQEKPNRPYKKPLILIEWLDAESKPQWDTKHDTELWTQEIFKVIDVGWLVGESKTYLTICSQISSDGDFGSKTKIPKSWILRKKQLHVK